MSSRDQIENAMTHDHPQSMMSRLFALETLCTEYRSRIGELERQVSAANETLAALDDEIVRLKQKDENNGG